MVKLVTRRQCLQIRVTVRKVSKHPLVRSSRRLQKHVVRGATLGLVPDAVNDVAFHHAPLNLNEVIHVVQDTTSVSLMTLALALAITRLKLPETD